MLKSIELLCLTELFQINWCVFEKEKNGKATEPNLATYENRFSCSFDFDSLIFEQGV